jgi:cytochrome c biogenesis protein CcmG, thiol:disulfide interchange protein DsbE
MMMLKKIKQLIPFAMLFGLLTLLWHELFYAKPNELPSALIGETIPDFKLPTLFPSQKQLTPKAFAGHVALLNVWATWCYACRLEQPMLMKIHDQYHVPIYSIDYKDHPDDAKKWLQRFGNPYIMIGNDDTGDVAIDLGVYGTPETFLISPAGKIVYRHVGVLDQTSWNDVIYPLLKRYENIS